MINRYSHAIGLQIRNAEQKRSYNRGLFTRVAEEYDSATRAMSLFRDAAWKRRLVAMLPEHTAPRCLDLACGTGDVTRLLAQRYPAGQIIGLDLTPAMLRVAQRQNVQPPVAFQAADMLALPIVDGSIDIITGSYALRNAPDLAAVLREIRRVLRPGGLAAFLDFRHHDNPRMSSLYNRTLKYWCGAMSIIVHGRPEHTYIAESLRTFPTVSELPRVLRCAGLQIMRRESAMFGTMDLVVCRAE